MPDKKLIKLLKKWKKCLQAGNGNRSEFMEKENLTQAEKDFLQSHIDAGCHFLV